MFEYISAHMTAAQVYGLFFILGTFAVATLSDIKKLAAQREFFEIWIGFVVIMFLYDIYAKSNPNLLALKWILIVGFSALSAKEIGVIFSLEIADISAIAATAALLTPFYIIIYFIILWIANKILAPVLLKIFSGLKKNEYPFMPVVFTATIIVLLFGMSGVLDGINNYVPFL